MTPRPRAYRLDGPEVVSAAPDAPEPRAGAVVVTEEPFEIVEAADGTPVPVGPRRRAPWLALFLSALGGLAMLAIGLGLERLIADLFAVAPWLGYLALALAVLAGLAFLALVARELAGMANERRIERLRQSAVDALAVRDEGEVRAVIAELGRLYGGRAQARAGLGRLAALDEEIMEPQDRLGLAELELLAGLDLRAKRAVADAAKQVSVVTAVSPRAIVDVAFVVFAAVRLLRTISRIYGGRPGFWGFLRLARSAFGHLAVTGGVAVGDSLVQQVLGLGLAARISAKLGEGVLNGLMTARFGLAAIAVCRPLPFVRAAPPRLGEVAGELLRKASDEAPPGPL